MPWAAVIGSPIDHSLSPVLHRAAWKSIGMVEGWSYKRIECDQDGLSAVLDGLDSQCRGLSVTMPCKQAIIPLLDVVDPLAAAVGSVNTVIPSAGILSGFNTDVSGISGALTSTLEAEPRSAVILGAGATAASALAALAGMGVRDLVVAARRFDGPYRICAAAHRLGVEISRTSFTNTDGLVTHIQRADVVVSTMPAHVCDALASLVSPRRAQVLLDVVYSPRHTDLVRSWRDAGGLVAHGIEMLTHQAVMQVKLMTGAEPDIEVMRLAVDEALKEENACS